MSKYDVNIDLANESKKNMAAVINKARDAHVLNRFGAFASLYDFNLGEQYSEPVLVLKTEEPGSKQLLAMQYDKIEGVCHDMINHLVNDCIVMGAKPLTVQDAIICGKLNKSVVTRIVRAIADACAENECVLTGGETSEQPGVIGDETFILTSSIVGVVEKKDIVDGSKIALGDTVLALESSGIHTNGYTLVRSIIKQHPEIMYVTVDGKPFIDAALTPHRCYYKSLKALLTERKLKGMAHITGGGIRENLNRILPETLDAEIDLSLYNVPSIFKTLKSFGDVSDDEMLRTFNLGVGMAIVVEEKNKQEVINHFISQGVGCYQIGQIVEGSGKVICKEKVEW